MSRGKSTEVDSEVWSFGGIKRTGLKSYQTVFMPTDGKVQVDPPRVCTRQPRGGIASQPLILLDLPGSLLHPEIEMLTLHRQCFLISVTAAHAT